MSVHHIQPLAHLTLHERLVEELRRLIVNGALAPGEKINEKLLCERFGVSRTPLREAIKSLAVEGLVELTPRRGVRIAAITLEDLAETFPVLGALEALACELACQRVTEEMLSVMRMLQQQMVEAHAGGELEEYFRLNQRVHRLIFYIAGNETLNAMRETLDHRVRRARYMANLAPARWAEAVEEHEAMLRALEDRDGLRLGALMKVHLANKHAALVEALKEAGEVEAV